MNRKKRISLFIFAAAVLAAAVCLGLHRAHTRVVTGEKEGSMPATHDVAYFELQVPHADPQMVGKWQNTDNPRWYKAYYDDYDEKEQLFWGKEWDESEDIFEEDLNYHGNGWFHWEIKDGVLHEYATMDVRAVPINHAYKTQFPARDSMICKDLYYKKVVFSFVRR